MSALGSIFGGDDHPPSPAPVPVSPADDGKAAQERADAERAAVAERAAAGRRSTIVAGMKLAEDEQMASGMLAQKKRAAARAMGY